MSFPIGRQKRLHASCIVQTKYDILMGVRCMHTTHYYQRRLGFLNRSIYLAWKILLKHYRQGVFPGKKTFSNGSSIFQSNSLYMKTKMVYKNWLLSCCMLLKSQWGLRTLMMMSLRRILGFLSTHIFKGWLLDRVLQLYPFWWSPLLYGTSSIYVLQYSYQIHYPE